MRASMIRQSGVDLMDSDDCYFDRRTAWEMEKVFGFVSTDDSSAAVEH